MTAAEFIGPRARFVSKMGQWVDVPGDVAAADPDILQWCWKYSNSGSPETGFRFERRVFEEAGKETFSMVYLPELHDDRPEIRGLARTERLLRAARANLADLEKRRANDLRAAARRGCSRRRLAAFIGISVARVQQLISQQESSSHLKSND
jgi:hypothetical protein